MPDEPQTVTGEPATGTNPSAAPPAPVNPTPSPAPPSAPAPGGGFDWQRLEDRLAAFGEQITHGIREAFPQPAPATPPASSTAEEKPGDNPPKEEPKSEPEHPTPGDHGGNKFAAWWFGSKR